MMNDAYHPHGAALLDCYRGNRAATLTCNQEGDRDDVPATFWLRSEMDPLETLALTLCSGRVLDVGAGAGLHSLELQRQGIDVTAIDVVKECVAIMCERGVRNAIQADLYDFSGGPFDTIICLCNGLDKVGRLSDLPRFLRCMKALLAPGGQLLADSFDVRIGADEAQAAWLARKNAAGRYFGEMDLRLEYNGVAGEPFTVLQVDYETLACISIREGWACRRVAQNGGHYLAGLMPAQR